MGYQQALHQAWEGVKSLGESPPPFLFFNRRVTILSLDRKIHIQGDNDAPNDYVKILLLHYLKNESKVDETVSDTWISFKDLDGGEIYSSVFRKRAIDPLLRKLKDDIYQLQSKSLPLGAESFNRGNCGVVIPVFPKIHVAVALWEADDEFEAECVMLFNPTIKILLPTEDVAVLGGLVASRL